MHIYILHFNTTAFFLWQDSMSIGMPLYNMCIQFMPLFKFDIFQLNKEKQEICKSSHKSLL